MPEQLTPELQALGERVHEFATRRLAPLVEQCANDGVSAAATRRQVIEASREAGVFGMTQPREFGGTAAGALALTVARDTLAACNPVPTEGVFGPAPGVLAGCGAHLRKRYLEPLMAGLRRGAFAFTEPEDAPRHTSAAFDGDEFIVNGRKSYVTEGAAADFLAVLVHVENGGPAMVIVDTDAAGVVLTRRFETLDGGHHAVFEFIDVRLPAANLVGRPGEGLPRALGPIGDARLAMAADAVGAMRWTLDHLTERLTTPRRAGEPLGAREGVRLRYAEARIAAYAARSMVYRTARLADRGDNVINEVIASKVFATETLGRIVDTAMQLVGGTALTVGHPLERLYRRARSMRLAEGASDALRLGLARGRLDLGKGRI